VPDAEEAPSFSGLSESAVTLEHELGQRSCFTRLEPVVASVSLVNKTRVSRANGSAQRAPIASVLVVDSAKTIRQPEAARSKADAERIRKPLREKINPGFAAIVNVSADVEKLVGRDRFEEPFAYDAAETRSHSHESEGDDGDKCLAVAQIELKRDLSLQDQRVDRVVDEDGTVPARQKKRLSKFGKEPLPACNAELLRRDRRRRLPVS